MKAYFGKKRYRQIHSATHGTEIWRQSPRSGYGKNARRFVVRTGKAV